MRKLPAAIAITTLLALPACSPHPAKPAAATPPSNAGPSASSAPSSPTAQPSQAPITAYTGLWHAYAQAVHHPDPSATSLRPYVTGDALRVFERGLAQLKQQGLVGKGDVTLGTPTVVSATAKQVTLSGCANTASTYLYKADGSAYHDSPGGKRLCTVQVIDLDGTWKVSEWALEAVGTC